MLADVRSAIMLKQLPILASALAAIARAHGAEGTAASQPAGNLPFKVTEIAQFNEPWAMTFLPDGSLLVTEKNGALKVYTIGGPTADIKGVPKVAYEGQGGLGDVVLHPKFAQNKWVYISYAEPGDGNTRGAAVARARLELGDPGGSLTDLKVIWRQVPKVEGAGHFGHRIAFDRDGKLWITSGERQKFDPAQDMKSNLGKLVRLNDDGSAPPDNPFAKDGGVAAEVWSLGHRNPLGLAFDAGGKLWDVEMGPQGGDELNLIVRGANYGYPIVSNGDHYDGRDIPDHATRPEFAAPKLSWSPVISPSSLVIYSGTQFPDWQGDALISGLTAQALVRVEFDGDSAREAARYDMGKRIRQVKQAPDGALWLLEDGAQGRVLKLTPSSPAPAPL